MEVNFLAVDPSVAITRPSNTTAYTAGDVVGQADSVTPANAGSAVLSFTNVPSKAKIEGITLMIAATSVPAGMTAFRLHLYSSSPDAILDNAAWDLSSATDKAAYLGYIEVTPVDLGSTLWVGTDSVNKRVTSTNGVLYGVLQTVAAYTPASGTVHTVTLKIVGV